MPKTGKLTWPPTDVTLRIWPDRCLGVAHLLDSTDKSVAGVVDQYIDATKCVDRSLDRCLYLGEIGHVQTHRAGATRILLFEVGNGFWFAGGGDNAIAIGQDRLCELRPKPVDAPVMNQTRDVLLLMPWNSSLMGVLRICQHART
jgi:hypothetical protein